MACSIVLVRWCLEGCSRLALAAVRIPVLSLRVPSLPLASSQRRSLLSAAVTGGVYSFLIEASSASSKAQTNSYLTIGEVSVPQQRLYIIAHIVLNLPSTIQLLLPLRVLHFLLPAVL